MARPQKMPGPGPRGGVYEKPTGRAKPILLRLWGYLSHDKWLLLLAAVFGLVDVALCWLLRTLAIQHIDPVTVATVSPCYAVITGVISVCVGIDKLSTSLLVGGSIIFISAVVPEVLAAIQENKKQ